MKRRARIIMAILLATTAIALLAVFFVARNLDSFVAAAIKAYGSDVAGVPVSVENVDLQLRQGEGTIDRLSVANPHGFSNNPIFNLEEIILDLVPNSLGSGTPVIAEIRVRAPEFLYEFNETGKTNLEVIRENVRRYGVERKSDQNPGEGESPLRLRIDRLIIERGKTIFDLTAKDGRQMEARTSRLVLNHIGGEGGVTPDALAEAIISALLRELEQSAASQGLE